MDEQLYYSISKVCMIEGVLTYTPIGYVLFQTDSDYIKNQVITDLMTDWIKTNQSDLESNIKTIGEFFTENSITHFYFHSCVTNYVPEGLNEITDLNNPEGVI